MFYMVIVVVVVIIIVIVVVVVVVVFRILVSFVLVSKNTASENIMII